MDDNFTPGILPNAAALARDPGWVQFTHRWLALTTGSVILAYAWRTRSILLAGAVLLQIGLGISTLLSQVWLPLAALHQAGAIGLLTVLLWQLHTADERVNRL